MLLENESATATPSHPVMVCPVCEWREGTGSVVCRSCGASLSGAVAPMPVPMPARMPVRQLHQAPAADYDFPAPRSPFPLGKLLFALLTLALIWKWWTGRAEHHPPGILVAEAPKQGAVPAGKKPWPAADAMVTPLAAYDITARVLHLERYRWDPMSDLAPLDLGAGWGVMSDETHVSRSTFSNMQRYLTWHATGDDFPAGLAEQCIANMHLLPATDAVRDRLLDLRLGQIVHLQGYLVEVLRPQRNPWTSSLSRLDTGNGACEIMWVESVTVSR